MANGSFALIVILLLAVVLRVNAAGAPPKATMPATVAVWTWSGMVDYDDPEIASGHGHAGGPGTYAAYTFTGGGVVIHAVKGLSVTVDHKTHRIGKLRISMDGKEIKTVDLASTDMDPNYQVLSVSNLSNAVHVLQVEPVGGWVVIDSATILNGSDPGRLTFGDGRLVAYFPFDQGTGTMADDASGGGHKALLLGNAYWTPDAKVGAGAMSFAGSGAVETVGATVDTSRSFTVCAWVKLANTNGYNTFVSIDGDAVSGFYLQLRDDHKFSFTMLHSDSCSEAARK